jgi:hypothetical protein
MPGYNGPVIDTQINMSSRTFFYCVQCERRAFAARRTDRAKEIGALVTLVGRLARSRSASSPLADEAVLLTDAGLVLEPDFDRSFLW